MPNIWVLCETSKNLANILCLGCEYYTILFCFFFYIFLITTSKMKNEGIAYNGPIILWWSLNENGSRFCNTLIIKLGPIGIEMQKNQVHAVPI